MYIICNVSTVRCRSSWDTLLSMRIDRVRSGRVLSETRLYLWSMYIALATAVGTYLCWPGEQLSEVDRVHMLHKADSCRHSHSSSRVDGDANTRVKLLSVFWRAELMCLSFFIRLYGVLWWDDTDGIRPILRAAVVELEACSTAHQILSLNIVRRWYSPVRCDIVGRRYGRFLRQYGIRLLVLSPTRRCSTTTYSTKRCYGIRLLVPSPSLHVYDVFDHAFHVYLRRCLKFAFWTNGGRRSECYAWLRRRPFISRNCRHCTTPA